MTKVAKQVVKKASKVIKKTSGNACNCFTAGTKVLTDEGEKNIEDIEVGDKVLAKDENNNFNQLLKEENKQLLKKHYKLIPK